MASRKTDRTEPAGTRMSMTGKNGPQVLRTTGKRWSTEAERLFLDHLYAHCNVAAAAEHAGFSVGMIYRRRALDPAFARAWQTALEDGYVRIGTALVGMAAGTLEGVAHDPDAPFPHMTVREAIAVLQFHRASVKGEGRRRSWPARPRTLDEMRASILIKLDAVEAARAKS